MSQLEINEEVLVNFSCASNDYQHGLRVLCTFVPNKSFAQLLDISIKVLFFKKPLIWSLFTLKYVLLTKIPNHSR